MITGLVVLKIVLMPSSTRRGQLRELRAAMVDDRRVHRAQDAVGQRRGPGMCRKWRPAVREEFLDIGVPSDFSGWIGRSNEPPAGTSRRAGTACRHQGRMRQSVKPIHRYADRGGAMESTMAVTLCRAGAPAQGGSRGRRAVRPLHPRPLCDRCVPLPDDAAGRRRAARRRGRPSARSRSRAQEGVSVLAARRRHVAMRADGQRVAGHRLLASTSTASSSSTSPAGAAWSSPASCSTSSTAR